MKTSTSTTGPSSPSKTESSDSPSASTTGLEESYAEIADHPPADNAPVVAEHGHPLGHPIGHGHGYDAEKTDSHPDQLSSSVTRSPARGEGGARGGKNQGEGAIALLAKVYREKGVAGWYKGLGAQIIKAVLCQGMSPPASSLSSLSTPLFFPFYQSSHRLLPISPFNPNSSS